MKNLTLFSVFALLPIFLFSQDTLETQSADIPPISLSVLADLFPGDGVEVLDWSFQGTSLAVGVFSDGMSAVGIDHGIVLTTGRASNGMSSEFGAESVGQNFASTSNSINLNIPDLNSIAGVSNTSDEAILTITFKPLGDEMHFKYAFASEEYPEWGCSSFNDVFGFFISGPGISGPFENNGVNIALIPGTTLPVSINNIHPQNPGNFSCTPAYEDFYNDNNHTTFQPVYDGVIDVFSSTISVQPLETYTLKLAIADAGDAIYDSAIFLEAESFESGEAYVISNASSVQYNPVMEGTQIPSLTFDLSKFGPWAFPFTATVSGTAEQGVDFEITGLPTTIGQADTILECSLSILEDAENEEIEYFKIEFESEGGFKFPFYFYINYGIIIPQDEINFTCDQEEVTLSVDIPDQELFFQFNNENPVEIDSSGTAYFSEIEVNDVPFDVLTDPSLVESVCLNIEHDWVGDLDLHLVAPNGRVLKLSTDNGSSCDDYANTCFSPSANQPIKLSSLQTPCSQDEPAPFTGSFLPESDWDEIKGSPINGTWTLVVLDDTPGFTGILQDWTISFDIANVFNPTYLWSTGDTTPTITVSPVETTTYFVTVMQSGFGMTDAVTVILNSDSISTSEITGTFCANEGFSVEVNGTTYNASNPMGMELFCDSIVNINLNFLEAPTGSLTANSTQVCPGEMAMIQLDFTGAAPFDAVLNVNGVAQPFSGLAAASQLEIPISEDTEISLAEVSGANGCIAFPGQTITIQVTPPPVAVAGFNGPLCPGFDLELEAAGGIDFLWTGPGGFTATGQSAGISGLQASQAGPYEVSVFDACGQQDVATVEVAFDCLVFTDTIFQGETGQVCFDEILDFAGGCDPATFTAAGIDGNCLVFEGLSDGTDLLCLQVVDGGDTSAVQVFVTSLLASGTDEQALAGLIEIYPNPTSGIVWLHWRKFEIQSAELYDLTGRMMKTMALPSNPAAISLDGIPEGTYFLRLRSTEGVFTKKVTVIR